MELGLAFHLLEYDVKQGKVRLDEVVEVLEEEQRVVTAELECRLEATAVSPLRHRHDHDALVEAEPMPGRELALPHQAVGVIRCHTHPSHGDDECAYEHPVCRRDESVRDVLTRREQAERQDERRLHEVGKLELDGKACEGEKGKGQLVSADSPFYVCAVFLMRNTYCGLHLCILQLCYSYNYSRS